MSSTKDLDLFRHACACCLHDLIGKYGPCQYMNDEKLRTSRMGWLDAKGVGWPASWSWPGWMKIGRFFRSQDQALAMQGARPKTLGACTERAGEEAERGNQSAFVFGQDGCKRVSV
jgi:hypothetical protein